MFSFRKKIIKKSLRQIKNIDDEIKKQSHTPNPMFKDFDKGFIEDIENTKKSIEKIKNSIHCTKK